MTTELIVPEIPRDDLQRRTEAIGRELFEQVGRGPLVWDRAWWDDRLMDLTLGDPEVKIQLFRFIDAMPALRTTEGVRSHFEEYLAEAGNRVPWWMALAVSLGAGSPRRPASSRGSLDSLRPTWPAGSSQARTPSRAPPDRCGHCGKSNWRSPRICSVKP